MLNFLDKLRQKPLYVRRQIALVTTLVLSFFIGSIWWNSWTLPEPAVSTEALQTSPTAVVAGVFSGMKDDTVSLWNDTVDDITSDAEGSTTVVSGAKQSSEEGGSDVVYPEDVFDTPKYTSSTTAQ